MEHEPVAGHDLVEPPDAVLARRYLTHRSSIVERREQLTDRRAGAWVSIVSAGIIAAYLAVITLSIRRGDSSGVIQALLVPVLIWGQLTSGIDQRSDRGRERTASRRLAAIGGAGIVVTALVFFVMILAEKSIPTSWMLVPIALVILGFGGYGVLRLVRVTREPRAVPPVRSALRPGVRWGTVVIGVFLGATCALGVVPDDILRSVLHFLVLLGLLVLLMSSKLGFGLPRIGASWRWPHLLMFTVSTAVLLALQLPAIRIAVGMPAVALLAAAGIVAGFALVSRVPGRDLDA